MFKFFLFQKHKDFILTVIFLIGSALAIYLVYKYQSKNLVFVFTAIIAIFTIVRHQRFSQRASTINLLTQDVLDEDLDNKLTEFYKIVRDNDIYNHARMINEPDDDKDIRDRIESEIKIILSVLSYYEFIACGIREGAFDYRLFHRLYRSNIIGIWDYCGTFICEYRKQVGKKKNIPESEIVYFQEIENLAREFKKHKIKNRIIN